MKKMSLFICAIAVSSVLFAVPTKKENYRLVENPKITLLERNDFAAEPVMKTNLLAKTTVDPLDTLFSGYYVPNSFVSGTPRSGLGYVDYATIYVPYCEEVTFYSRHYWERPEGYIYAPGTWTVAGEVVASDTIAYTIKTGEFRDDYPVPAFLAADVKLNDDSIYTFKSYEFGKYFTSKYAKHNFVNGLGVAPYWIQSLTQCEVYTEVEADSRGEDTYGTGWSFVGAKPLGTYAYGTKLSNPYAEGTYFDTIISVINNNATMYISYVSLGVFTAGDGGVSGIFPDKEDHVKLTLYALSEKGVIDWANPIAEAVADSSSYIGYKDETSWYGILNFYFTETDPLGAVSIVPAVVEGDFVAVLTEFNAGTADFGIITDYYSEFSGQTYFKFAEGITSLWRAPSNLLMNFYAIFPTILDIPETIVVPLAGETKELTINTNVAYEYMEYDADEWISLDGESLTEGEGDEEEYLYQDKLTITVEPSTENRVGELTIDALGKIYTIKIVQGDEAAVDNVKVLNDNKRYNLLGVEVDEDYNGIVIMNGKKFIQ